MRSMLGGHLALRRRLFLPFTRRSPTVSDNSHANRHREIILTTARKVSFTLMMGLVYNPIVPEREHFVQIAGKVILFTES